MGKNLDQCKAYYLDRSGDNVIMVESQGGAYMTRTETEKAATLDEQEAYNRAIRDVVAWIRDQSKQCADEPEADKVTSAVLRVCAGSIERGDARGFADKERT